MAAGEGERERRGDSLRSAGERERERRAAGERERPRAGERERGAGRDAADRADLAAHAVLGANRGAAYQIK